MAWRLAKSLETFRDQVNTIAPRRSKASDGTIGDAAHSSRDSDHNPLDHDHNPNTAGVVCAIDITHDPENGMDCEKLAKALVASRDSRIKYIIWNRGINSPTTQPWAWRAYNGTNPHTKHLHLSVVADVTKFDATTPWKLGMAVSPTDTAIRKPMPPLSKPYTAGELAALLEWLIEVIKEQS